MKIEQLLTHEDKQVRELAKELSNFELPYHLNYVHDYNLGYPRKIEISISLNKFDYVIEFYQSARFTAADIFGNKQLPNLTISSYFGNKYLSKKAVNTNEEILRYLTESHKELERLI